MSIANESFPFLTYSVMKVCWRNFFLDQKPQNVFPAFKNFIFLQLQGCKTSALEIK